MKTWVQKKHEKYSNWVVSFNGDLWGLFGIQNINFWLWSFPDFTTTLESVKRSVARALMVFGLQQFILVWNECHI